MGMIDTIKKNMKKNPTEIKQVSNQYDKVFNNYDYSNAIPTKESVTQLVKYLNSVYDYYLWIVKYDENKQHKYYNYEKNYNIFLNIRIRNKKYSEINCKNFESFMEAIKDGKLDNIDNMEIVLNLNYTKEKNFYDNLFMVTIKPFNLIFSRKSNHAQVEMNTIEDNINEILKRFNCVDSLFCTK